MKKQRTDGQETRQRLLAAASEVFAEKGFWETTNADICERAKVNTAAVNYHFSSKENLYVEAWKYSFERSVNTYPPDGGVTPESPLQDKLRGRVLSFMHRIADPQTYDIDIIHKEMACPTSLLTGAIEEAIEPIQQGWETLIKEMLGEHASEQQIRFCYMNITALCFGPLLHVRHSRMVTDIPRPKDLPAELDVEVFADHTARFILAGIHGIREEGEKRRKGFKEKRRSGNASKQE
jgi:AcrR family transcriptional regulator